MEKKRDSYHHGDLRATLLEVAARMIADQGVEGVTMRGLADRIGVSRSAPYRHFADKAALLAAVAEDGFKRLAAGLRAAGAEQAGDPLLSFRSMCLAYVEFAVEHPTHYRLMFGQAVFEWQDYPSLVAAADGLFGEVFATVRACQQQNKLKPGEPRQTALAAWALAHGLSLLLVEGRLPAGRARQLAEATFESLLTGIEIVPK
jgi:AcrR family transcriptional regulator